MCVMKRAKIAGWESTRKGESLFSAFEVAGAGASFCSSACVANKIASPLSKLAL